MIVRNYTTVGFQCFKCGNVQKKKLNTFEYSGNKMFNILCDSCNKSVASLERKGKDKYKFSFSCVECGSLHSCTFPVNEFWQTDLKKIKCPDTSDIAFVIGSDTNVLSVIEENFLMSKPEENAVASYVSSFMETEQIFDVIDHFEALTQRGKINCKCGENNLNLQIEENGIRLCCSFCGREIFFGVSSFDELTAILRLSEINLE